MESQTFWIKSFNSSIVLCGKKFIILLIIDNISSITDKISNIEDDVIRDLEIKKISKLTNVDSEIIKSKIKTKTKEVKVEIKPVIKFKENKYDKASKLILFNMIRHTNIIQYYFNNLSYLHRRLASEIVLFFKKYNSFNLVDFITYLGDNSELVKRVSYIDSLEFSENYSMEEIDNYFDTNFDGAAEYFRFYDTYESIDTMLKDNWISKFNVDNDTLYHYYLQYQPWVGAKNSYGIAS